MLNRTLRIHSAAICYFDMVRRCHSIREAARRLNVASSAVNRQILKLEDEVGAVLFERLPEWHGYFDALWKRIEARL